MKNKLTRKLLLSVLTLAFAVVSLGASTFAWFTLSTDAKVSAFTANVKAAEGIEIAVSDKDSATASSLTWYSGTLPQSAILAASRQLSPKAGDAAFAFSPLTTSNGYTMYNRNSTTSVGLATYATANDPTTAITAHGGYVQFYVYLRALAAGTVTVSGDANQETDPDVNFVAGNVQPFTVDASFTSKAVSGDPAVGATYALGDKIKDSIVNAARLSLHIVSGTGTGTQHDGIFEYIETQNSTSDVTKIMGNSQGGTTPTATTDASYIGAHEYYHKKTQQFPSDPAQTAATKANFTSGIAQYADTEANILKVLVTVWVEGTDYECMNALFSQSLTVDFTFRYNATPANNG